MKRLIYLITAAIGLFSCEPREVDLKFEDTPDGRITDTLTYLKNTLVEAPYGWVGYTTTELSGGYGFYFEFAENDRVKMMADLTDETASEVKESTYRVRQIMSATLSFDTYTYITMLQDPNPNTFGGEAGKGLGSDVEYEYLRTSGDTLYMKGRKFGKDLILIQASQAEKEAYVSGEYLEAINKTKQFFLDNANPYIIVDDIQYQISANAVLKSAESTAVMDNDSIAANSAKFYYGLDGIHIPEGLAFGDVLITKLIWGDGDAFSAVDASGQEIEVENAPEPFIPLHYLIGAKYVGLYSDYRTIYPGTSEQGAALLNSFHDNVSKPDLVGYSFDYGYLQLVWNVTNQRIELRGASYQLWNNNPNPFVTTYVFDYQKTNDGIYSLTHRSGPSGGYVSAIMGEMVNFLTSNSFSLDYEVSNGVTYGKITGIENPDVVMTFELE